ncbi:MAG TPA: PspC domain-containing protein, partial [Bacteroidia bacterium]|nr:PspC domain-containing protein [Bacteroidia bacterium]
MNKTITSNISGIIFYIEEDAYEKLQAYLNKVRYSFSAEEGRDEIMADIEARIAEIFSQRISDSKQVIVMADVDHVIAQMGEPGEFAENAAEEKQEDRDEQQRTHRTYRRLYRDPDDKIVGGVCSGLGYYFDVDPVWIRIAFVAVFFLFGSGILFYILLLIIIPKANTTTEKLEMRGEPVDVNNIRKTIREEFEGVKKRVEDFGDDAKQFGNKWRDRARWSRKRGSSPDIIHDLFRGALRFFAFLMVVFGILFLVGLLTSTFSLSDFGPEFLSASFRNLFSNGFNHGLAIASILLVFGIPIMMMIYKGLRILFRIDKPDRPIVMTALILWICGIVTGSYSMVNAAGNFADGGSVSETIVLPAKDTLYVKVNIDRDMENIGYRSRWNRRHDVIDRWRAVSINGEDLKLGYADFTIVKSNSGNAELVLFKSARGNSRQEAVANARLIRFPATVTDSLITLPNYFALKESSMWRAQQVVAELRIPENTVVYLHPSTRDMLSDVDNIQNAFDPHMADRRWKMTEKGLTCIDCAGLNTDDND